MSEEEEFLKEVRRRSRGAALWGMDQIDEAPGLGDVSLRISACRAVVEVAEFVAEQVWNAADEQEEPACVTGCHFCCYAPVTVSTPEAQWLAESLMQTRDEEALLALAERIAAHAQASESLELAERFARGLPCPLLELQSGQCSVYDARPLRCRGANSLSQEQCESACRGQSSDVDVHALLFDVYAEATRGLAEAFAECGEKLEMGCLSGLVARALREALEQCDVPVSSELVGELAQAADDSEE